MSDTFDHEWDAWDDRINRADEADEADLYTGGFCRDPLYYHARLAYKRIVSQDARFITIQVSKETVLRLPLKICRNITATSCYVHKKTFARILNEHRGAPPAVKTPTRREVLPRPASRSTRR